MQCLFGVRGREGPEDWPVCCYDRVPLWRGRAGRWGGEVRKRESTGDSVGRAVGLRIFLKSGKIHWVL